MHLALTPIGHERVNALATAHLEELRRLAPLLDALARAGRGFNDERWVGD